MNQSGAAWTPIVRRAYWVGGAGFLAGMLGLLVPEATAAAQSWIVGLLVGVLNVQMLTRALERGLGLTPGRGATATLSVSGVLRLVLVLGVLAWAGLHMRHVAVVPLLGGVFLPEAVVVVGLARAARETREKGDSP